MWRLHFPLTRTWKTPDNCFEAPSLKRTISIFISFPSHPIILSEGMLHFAAEAPSWIACTGSADFFIRFCLLTQNSEGQLFLLLLNVSIKELAFSKRGSQYSEINVLLDLKVILTDGSTGIYTLSHAHVAFLDLSWYTDTLKKCCTPISDSPCHREQIIQISNSNLTEKELQPRGFACFHGLLLEVFYGWQSTENHFSCCDLGSLTAGVEWVSVSWTLPESEAGVGEHSWNAPLPNALLPCQSSLLWKRWTSRKVPLDPEGDGAVFWVIPLSRFDRRSQNLGTRCEAIRHLCVSTWTHHFYTSVSILLWAQDKFLPCPVHGVTDTVLWRAGKYHCCCLSCECWTGAGSSMFKT